MADSGMISPPPPPSPYLLLLESLTLIPLSHYLLALAVVILVFLYNLLEIHFLQDFLSAGLRGHPVSLCFSPASDLYHSVASKCRLLDGRYCPTPWLSSPHLQTAYLGRLGKSPDFKYTRHIFRTRDAGTVALDWLKHSDVKQGSSCVNGNVVSQDEKVPIVFVIPGLTSDSASAYVKHLAFKMATTGWDVVVCNHRGLGGISITSDCFYNAGWTEDIREVIDNIRREYPEAPLYAVGTSIGANILVKYLGEDGVHVPFIGAAAVCSPWDLLICDRFMNRNLVQRFYNRVLAGGLRGYAKLHQSVLSRLTNWDGIETSLSVRDFDNHATRILAKYETVDTYYRRSSCANYVGHVSVPILCISALDDPVCTKEAIPWDECRLNENVILATTQHGGHLAFYEGLTANSMWWVRAVDEFLHVLHCSPLRNRSRKTEMSGTGLPVPLESSIDRGPFVNVTEDGMVAAVGNIQGDAIAGDVQNADTEHSKEFEEIVSSGESDPAPYNTDSTPDSQPLNENLNDVAPARRRIDQLVRYSRNSIWLLAYIAIVTSWPHVGPAIFSFLKKRFKNVIPAALLSRGMKSE